LPVLVAPALLPGAPSVKLSGPDALLPLEQPAAPATIVTAAMAINNSRFTKFSLGRDDLVKQYVLPRDYLLGKPAMNF
jgi:hypothetical protein